MEIRPATSEDVEAIQAHARAAYQIYVARIGREPAPMVADFAAQVAAGQVHVMVEDARILGYVVFESRDDHLHLENVAVDPALKGQGIGGALIAFVEAEARRAGLVAVELYTNRMMHENLAMYPALGYRETGRRTEDGFERVYFRKEV